MPNVEIQQPIGNLLHFFCLCLSGKWRHWQQNKTSANCAQKCGPTSLAVCLWVSKCDGPRRAAPYLATRHSTPNDKRTYITTTTTTNQWARSIEQKIHSMSNIRVSKSFRLHPQSCQLAQKHKQQTSSTLEPAPNTVACKQCKQCKHCLPLSATVCHCPPVCLSVCLSVSHLERLAAETDWRA